MPAGQWWGGAGAMWLRRRGDRVQPRPLDGLRTVCREPGPECGGASPVGPLQPVAPPPPPPVPCSKGAAEEPMEAGQLAPLQRGRAACVLPQQGGRGDEGLEPLPPWQGLHGGALCPPCRSANRSCQPQIQVRTPRAQRLRRFLEIKWGECADTSSVRPRCQPPAPLPKAFVGLQGPSHSQSPALHNPARWTGQHTHPCPSRCSWPTGALQGSGMNNTQIHKERGGASRAEHARHSGQGHLGSCVLRHLGGLRHPTEATLRGGECLASIGSLSGRPTCRPGQSIRHTTGLRRQGLATPWCGHVLQAGVADGTCRPSGAPVQALSGTAVPCSSQLGGGTRGGPNSTCIPHPPRETER